MSLDRPLSAGDVSALDWEKGGGLLPAIVQDADNGAVLMLGYMNREALLATFERGRVVFHSRSRNTLWEKGETSGHSLKLVGIEADCDQDTLLVRARPVGPACHRNTPTCFGDGALHGEDGPSFLTQLEGIIAERIAAGSDGSYTAKLHARGVKRMAQKVGEEGLETALAATAGDDRELVSESADLLFHLLLLLQARGLRLESVIGELRDRHRARHAEPR